MYKEKDIKILWNGFVDTHTSGLDFRPNIYIENNSSEELSVDPESFYINGYLMSASNAFAKRILFAAAPKNIDMKVLSVADAIEYLKGEQENERVFVMAKVPGPVLTAVKEGVEFKEVNLGNMGGGPGRKRFNKNVNASDQEVSELREIVDAGIPVIAQMVPTDAKIDLKSLL